MRLEEILQETKKFQCSTYTQELSDKWGEWWLRGGVY